MFSGDYNWAVTVASSSRLELSIITVVRNNEAAMRATLATIAENKREGVEYIVVDGASTDGTLALIQGERALVDVLISEPDSGIYDAMNKGVRAAQGRWLLFLNAGDLLRPDQLKQMLTHAAKFEDCSDIAVVSGRVWMLDTQGQPLGYTHPLGTVVMNDLLDRNCVAHQASLISRRAFEIVGEYSTSYRVMGDYEFWIRLMRAGKRIEFVDNIVADFVANGISSNRAMVLTAQHERFDVLVLHGHMSRVESTLRWFIYAASFYLKSAIRQLLGQKISTRIALARSKRA